MSGASEVPAIPEDVREAAERAASMIKRYPLTEAGIAAVIESVAVKALAARPVDTGREKALEAVEAERDQALYWLHHADFALVNLQHPDDSMATCTGLNLDALAAAKRLRERGLVTIKDSGAGPIVRWAPGRGRPLANPENGRG